MVTTENKHRAQEAPTNGHPRKPKVAFPTDWDGVAELAAHTKNDRVWAPWRLTLKDGRWAKMPINVHNGGNASITDPETWCTLIEARAYVESGKADGVNIVTGPASGIWGKDFDKCERVPDCVPDLPDWLTPHWEALGRPRVEVSPSGTGLHMFLKVECEEQPNWNTSSINGCEKVESFYGKHFLSVTGHWLEGEFEDVDSLTVLKWSIGVKCRGKSASQRRPEALAIVSTGTDDEIWERVGRNPKFAKLQAGDRSDYGDNSGADTALCCEFARHTNKPDQLRKLMARAGQAGLWREKWDTPRGDTTWLGDLVAYAISKQPVEVGTPPRYERRPDGMYEIIKGIPFQRSNFTAQLVEVVSLDRGDGTAPESKFTVALTHEGKQGRCTLTAEEPDHSSWVRTHMGSWAPTARISGVSPTKFWEMVVDTSERDQITNRRRFARMGWFDGVGYVTGTGVITPAGLDTTYGVELPINFRHYGLPAPRTSAVGAVLDLLDFRSHAVTFPLLASMYGSVVGHSRLTLHLVGQPGSGKTETACLFMRHFGVGFSSDEPTATWDATAKAIVGLLAACADAPLLVDDLIPDGDQRAISQVAHKVDEVIGAQGNGQGRDRCGRDGKPLPPPVLRGLLLSTGEGWLARESRTARTVQVPFDRDDLDAGKYQAVKAKSPELSEAMAAYIQWCAARLDELRRHVAGRVSAYERRESGNRHARYGKTTGWLVGSFELFTRFAEGVGAIDAERRRALDAEAAKVIEGLIRRQSDEEVSAKPHQLFLDSLRVAFTTNKAKLIPIGETKIGRYLTSTDERAELVGWVVGDDVYLLPTPAHDAAVASAPNNGIGIPAVKGLGEALKAAKLLTKLEGAQTSPKVKIPGHDRQRVWCLKLASIADGDDAAAPPKF